MQIHGGILFRKHGVGRYMAWVIGGLGCGCAVALLVATTLVVFRTEIPLPLLEPGRSLALQAPVPGVVGLPLEISPIPFSDVQRDETMRQLRDLGVEPSPEQLAEAAANGASLTVDLLLKAGVTPNAIGAGGKPALLIATEKAQGSIVSQLLIAGADANAAYHGWTPLMAAAWQGNIFMMECLSQNGAAIDRRDATGYTALHFALFSKETKAARWLIAHEAPLEEIKGVQSPLSCALETRNATLIEAMLQGEAKLHPVAWNHETRAALYEAIRFQDKPVIRVLLANHSEPPTPEGFHQPLLGYAIAWGDTTALRLLLECGANANILLGNPVERAFTQLVPDEEMRFYLQKEQGLTPLMLAAGMGRLDCVQTLMEFGAKRGMESTRYKMAALSFAARGRHPEVMQVLLGKSPLPEDQRTRVDISLSNQRAVLWKNDHVSMAAPVSTGRPGFPTPSGRFVVTDKNELRYSSIYKVNMPFFMRLSCSEFGMHAGDVPNYPASHGCIRLPRAAAIRFFEEVEVGTLVTIRP